MSTSSLQPTAGSPSTVLDVYPSSPQHALSAAFYSLFLETEINFGGEGGLLADQIWNGDLEALGRDDWSRPTEDGGRSSLDLRRTQLDGGGWTELALVCGCACCARWNPSRSQAAP